MYRQGDVLIRPLGKGEKVPSGLKSVPRDRGRVVLAYGEVTGHAHVVECEREDGISLLASDLDIGLEAERFLQVRDEAGAQIVHDEHGTIEVPPGDYEIVRQREYAPEAPQWVAD
jgi:hypothetical protein